MGLVVYNGSEDGVDVYDPQLGRYVHCPKGVSVLVSDTLEAALLQQSSVWGDGGDGAPAYSPPGTSTYRAATVPVVDGTDAAQVGKFPRYDGGGAWSFQSVPSANLNPAKGVYVPKGSLDRAVAALKAPTTGLYEFLWFGDSTSYGQTGSAVTRSDYYSLVQRVRQRMINAGIKDGGVGLRGVDSPANLSGPDNIAHVASSTGANWILVGGTGSYFGPYLGDGIGITNGTGTNGHSLTVQGYGDKARIVYVDDNTNPGTASGYATWHYKVDSGAWTAAPAPLGGRGLRLIQVDLPDDSAVHTITVELTSDGKIEFGVEWLRNTGICWQNVSRSGQRLNGRFDPTSTSGLPYASLFGVGENANINTDPVHTAVTTGIHKPTLAVLALGINDQQLGATDQATAQASCASMRQGMGVFAEMCRRSDVDMVCVVPHLLFAANYYAYGGLFRSTIFEAARSYNMATVDFQVPVGDQQGPYYVGSVHLEKPAYDAQADYLWDNVFAPLL